ncbi:hydantoinase B/oxoprolinase family protein [Pseudactinotalea sp. Z1732]|uniref:hydantoinase B/oxoprolinase family protein n=1 Tax=Micrococcales TaxID=85006 RepID=UPI003C7BEC0B
MGWQFWIDRGGTFTDVVARDSHGELHTHKLLSEDPERYDDAAVEAIGRLLPTGERIDAVKMGTTIATNALLERRGEPTVLVITAGFADALRIGYQDRPRIFDRQIVLPELLHTHTIEADERLGADGQVLRPLRAEALRDELAAARAEGYRAVAIAFLHSYREPVHEQQAAQIAREVGFTQVSTSAEVSPLMKLISRADTCVVDAYLSPLIDRYIAGVQDQLPGTELSFMQSSGGLAPAEAFRGKDAILSGPAGGIVGMARTSQAAGFDKVIGFDMGGTSTDVSHFAGQYERQFETQVAGVRMRAPMMSIHTVAAGGGSILHFDGSRYRVGPNSAGARPGPASYRAGGPLTLTDANVMLGRIHAEFFPRVFGDGTQPLDTEIVATTFAELAARIDDGRSPEQVAAGFRQIGVANMANAIKKISIQRGYDTSDYTLSTFGGAGGQHACAVADELGITRVLIHPLAGVLSAYGMGLADLTAMRERSIEAPLAADLSEHLEQIAGELATAAAAELGAGADEVHARAHLRYAGTDTSLQVPLGQADQMLADFEAAYRRRFSFLMSDKEVIVEAVSVEAVVSSGIELTEDEDVDGDPANGDSATTGAPVEARAQVPMFITDAWQQVPLYERADLPTGQVVNGPAIIAEDTSTTVVEAGWSARATSSGNLLLRAVRDADEVRVSTERDPVRLEIFNNLFMSIAEQMGVRLRGTAQSVNIKERLDFSCAIFDAQGNLIANAPHIPVHLGSMGESIRMVMRRNAGTIGPGQVFALNDPYNGGTHLPDVTVVTPVFIGQDLQFFVASRGHHAEIGGITPGSMPAFSRHLDEEGVVIDNWLLVSDGRMREAETIDLLTSGPHPSRNPRANLADLRAQIAANERGVAELRAMVDTFGTEVVQAYMGHVRDNAAEAVRRVIDALDAGSYSYEMDSGAVIVVRITPDPAHRTATIDFTGTSEQLESNFNAPSAVAKAAVLYVFRTLVDDEIPLNDGCLEPLEIIIPEGSMLAPTYPAAVVAGNVETSQAITGALYAALGVQAEGAGTMNNVTFGNDEHQYYETLSSGSGAGDGFDGTDVVQTHMTNSWLTDPEVLEWRLPVRVDAYQIRRGSGGAGRFRGGDGGRRRLQFTQDVTVTVLSGHRRIPPYGMAGGQPGALGRHWVEHPDGSTTEMAGCDSVDASAGDTFVIETPGGGGYGSPARE